MEVYEMNYYTDVLPGDISKSSPHKFDKEGVIMTKIPYTQEYHYHATSIASYAIMSKDKIRIFESQIEWLMNNIDDDGAYRHHFILPFYENFPKVWVGGLAQGLAISALLLADERKTAKQAFNCMKKECVDIDENGCYWIEEYPLTQPVRILNGFIYALFGVYDLFKKTNNPSASLLWHEGIKTVRTNLNRYDLGSWSKYDLLEELPATKFYNEVHVKQLTALYIITKDDLFMNYAERWNEYTKKIQMMRIKKIVKKNGIIGCWSKYRKRKRWLAG